MKLTHKSKVKTRKALATLRESDARVNSDDPMTDAIGASGMVVDAYHASVKRTVQRAGFRNRDELERFAAKHRIA